MIETKKALYLNMTFGTIGTILILLSAIKFLNEKGHNSVESALILFGFILVVNYIIFLEKKAGISAQLSWMRIGLSIILSLVCLFVFLD